MDWFLQNPFVLWLTIGAVLLAVEVGTGSGWLLWPAASAAVLGLIGLGYHFELTIQLVIFALLTIVTTLAGRRLFPQAVLTGGDINDVTRTASDIVASEDADLVMGSHISAVRVALRKVVAGHIPYLYTPVYEGGERTPGVMAIGETPGAQWRPAIEWLANTRQASNWYLIGSDYVWPWLSHKAIKKYIADAGGRVVGEEFVPIGEHNHSSQLERIRTARPDVVLITLIGADSVVFNRAFAEQGLGSRMLRLAGAMDETVLFGIGADNTENLFCASGYFIDMASRENDAFRGQYEASFGRHAPPLGSIAQSNYEGLRFLETVAARAGSLARKPLLSAAANVDYQGARGSIGIRRGSARMPIYLAAANGLDFRLIKQF